ncbi:Metal-dependent hydrolase, endonuclease/exonuclease/phosphatase family [Chitinophaga eiseniae]|uniref:Metal-dependent hydrolase, endonuclease/exonuclease/phosphatase family n=1 Tax=Chitinophaga eiseniae TaxID=634771 RepID=A0A1T4RN34_9BACT|nr:endonuclease/exonuclease/phosphatase family protein [Chitinophaga eiseniae]SKA17410.1 Metal-dependent hydrolase, endonuclease/exonuclease/phosphatase family [Chitinophaga eiseniae]
MRFLRLFTKGFFVFINVGVVVLFLAACLAPYISPAWFWPISFITLAFPFLLGLLVIFLAGWLFFNYKYAFLSLTALFLGWKSISAFLAFNLPSGNKPAPAAQSLTVMSYNVSQFGLYREKDSKYNRQAMFALIKKQEPDIACFQDFYTSERKNDFNNREDISREMKMPFRFFSSDFNRNGMQHWGSIIFSKYPIIASDKVKMSMGPLSESLIYADIVKDDDTIRIVNMHLESYRFNEKDYTDIRKIKNQEDTGLVATKNIIQKMREAYIRRSQQADIVGNFIRQSPYPVIVCGDFNDTPASYTYFTIKGNLQDAFLNKGWGVGRTFNGIAPTLRIDYVFASTDFKVNSFRRIISDLSDHYPVIANLSLVGSGVQEVEVNK